jgi:hypothetical protein
MAAYFPSRANTNAYFDVAPHRFTQASLPFAEKLAPKCTQYLR